MARGSALIAGPAFATSLGPKGTVLSFRAYIYDKQNNANNGAFGVQQWMYGPFAALKCDF